MTLALTELERMRCEKALTDFMARRRPPPHLRDRLDLGYRMEGQSIEIFEIPPDWKDDSVRQISPWPRQLLSEHRASGKCSGCAQTSNGTGMHLKQRSK